MSDITNEIKAKVFAQYLGHKHTHVVNMTDGSIDNRGVGRWLLIL